MKTDTNLPLTTYRIQFNETFTFRHLEEILDYLQQLGITTIYASPIFDAVPGSMHGYDGINPHRINPAIGTLEDLRRISASLQQRGMSWVQDIVPNHMALHPGNAWLMDALERGPVSPWYHFFDIDWEHHDPRLHGRLMIPFLGQPLTEAIAAKQIRLAVSENGFVIDAAGMSFPLSAPAYDILLDAFEELQPEIKALLQQLKHDIHLHLPAAEWQQRKQALFAGHTPDDFLAQVNHHEALLHLLLEHQFYLLTYWRETEQQLNYRRFFTVNGLITLRMEDKAVFDTWHRFLLELYGEGLIQGWRIDHIDGLLEPAMYIRRLREAFGEDCYIIAEKILAEGESLPGDWKLNGTTGYEFLADVNHLLTNTLGEEKISRFYRGQFPELAKYGQLVQQKKTMILQTQLGAEWDNLVWLLFQYQLAPRQTDRQKLKAALGLWMVCMPVYRIYPESWPLPPGDVSVLETALALAADHAPALSEEFRLLHTWWQEDYERPSVALKFLKRMMQFTGPLMAKGVEDTVFYVYNALLSHNEVGDAPVGHHCSPAAFHERSIRRQQQFPGALNTTATHDTKRGEDARIRINMLTLLPDTWIQQLQQWHEMNSSFGEAALPAKNDEFFIYQSIIGGYPENEDLSEDFIQRLSDFLIKALREAKERSNWAAPDEDYENTCLAFIQRLFDPSHTFIESIRAFMEKIHPRAAQYALSQQVLKITAPGVPDIYQGCELWDFSFVDPDNRRLVDYISRMNMLSLLQQQEQEDRVALFKLLTENRRLGWEKMFVVSKALAFRKANGALFQQGDYIALSGQQDPLIAYARQYGNDQCIVLAALPEEVVFEQRYLLLDSAFQGQWQDIFTGESIGAVDGKLPLALLDRFPVALLKKISD
ncbi:malto-oligosyltrehalose synthase [Chitinophaga arvensicola]|uniref:Maltooligosyl trehalose synthase n=1 Tax=Chitinophaga arvensicola TaxID=29529 RepID=A0A1I0RRS8_9BACT|nr:malto-oligosyltrehalose synthase [Chitinophaga arvensicola]SEW44057.1 maltooligosyl trehalose synthase [Chitinophaga arvensicola]